MPIEFIDRFKEVDLSVKDLELEAKTNEGFIIRNIEGQSSLDDNRLRVIIQDTTMLNIPIQVSNIGLIPIKNRNVSTRLLFEQIRDKYPDVPLLKVAEGEKLVLTNGGLTGQVRLHYVQVDGGDIPSPTDEGGSLGKIKLFLSSAKQNFSITGSSTEIKELITSVNPAGMFQFPFGQDCPANYRMEILGFVIGFDNKGANLTIDGFRIWHRDQAILGKDEEFALIESFPYMISTKDYRICFLSDREIVISGDTIKTEFQITNADAAAETVDMYMTYIIKQIKEV